MTASEINMTYSNESHWEILAQIVDDLQSKVSLKQINTIPALLQALTQTKQLPGITPQELSVVYRDYGQSRYEWVVYEGHIVTDASTIGLVTDNPAIIKVLDGEENIAIEGSEKCHQSGFEGFQCVFIDSMKLDDQKRVGAFVIRNKEISTAYNKSVKRILDVLSDRMALLIRLIQQRVREEEVINLRRLLLKQSGSFKQEAEILSIFLNQLKHWYQVGNIYILIKNPLDILSYYQVNCKDRIVSEFRLTETLSLNNLHTIVGSQENLDSMRNLNFEYIGNFINKPSSDIAAVASDVKSWLGATIYHEEGVILGHIVLHNTEASHAYGDEDVKLLSKTCVLLGAELSKLRIRQKDKLIRDFDNNKNENSLYDAAFDYLKMAYGVNSLLVYTIQTATQDWDVAFHNGIFDEPDSVFRERVIKIAQDYREEPSDVKQYIEYPDSSNQKYLVVPMRTKDEDGDFRVIGCFVIPAQNQGILATRIIDEISDALAKRIKELDDDERQEKLNEYIEMVSKISPSELTLEKVIKMAEEAITEIMFSANLYFALYDQDNNEISFSVIYKDGKPWEDLWDSKRPLNKEKRGRTEEIILTGQSILIKTLATSKAWYEQPGRQEFAGNPLASWVGVPIFNDKGVRGVIAVYHPDLDYVYSSKDLGFLKSVAGAISSLFRMVELEELYQVNEKSNKELTSLNKNLKNANKKIIELENANTMSLLSQDLTHRLNNSISILKINAEQAIDDISVTQKTGNIQLLTYTVEGLKDSISVVNDLYSEIREIISAEDKDIDVTELIKHIAAQIKIVYKLNHQVKVEINKNTPNILRGKYRLVFNAIYSLADNAAKSLLSVKERVNSFIRINAYRNDNFVVIEVIDNGGSVSENALSDINDPSLNKGHYGLWRTKHILESMGGSYNPEIDTISNIKKIGLHFPIKCEESDSGKGVALVLDDEGSWRNILRRWLVEYGFEVKLAASVEEMDALISENKNIGAAFLDVSLNKVVGSDASGLSVIDKVRNKFSHAKVFVVTGYEHFLQNTTHDIDHVFKKIEDNGDALNKDYVYKILDGFFVK